MQYPVNFETYNELIKVLPEHITMNIVNLSGGQFKNVPNTRYAQISKIYELLIEIFNRDEFLDTHTDFFKGHIGLDYNVNYNLVRKIVYHIKYNINLTDKDYYDIINCLEEANREKYSTPNVLSMLQIILTRDRKSHLGVYNELKDVKRFIEQTTNGKINDYNKYTDKIRNINDESSNPDIFKNIGERIIRVPL